MHPRTEVIQSGKVRNLDVTESLTYQGTPFVPSAATDEKSKVSSNDTTPGFLNGKLVAGTNITLTENNNGGNETLTISAAGGGGTTGFTPTQNTAAPNATINASRLLVNVATSSGDAVLQPKGFGAVMAQLPDSTDAGGNKRGSYAVDWQMHRATAAQVATGNYSVVLGGSSNTASQDYSVVGGRQNTVTGYSAIAAGYLNQTQNTYCFIGSGQSNTASGQYSVITGGQSNTSSGAYSAIVGGSNNLVSGTNSIAGGDTNTVAGTHSTSFGSNNNITNTSTLSFALGERNNIANGINVIALGCKSQSVQIQEAIIHAHGDFGIPSVSDGAAQQELYVFRATTTDNSGTDMWSGVDGYMDSIAIYTDSTYTFEMLVTARRSDANNESAGWKITGIVHNNGAVTFVGSPTVTAIGSSFVGGTASVSLYIGGSGLYISATGINGKTIRWVCVVNMARVTG